MTYENAEMVAGARWRGAVGNEFDADFETFWAKDLNPKVSRAIKSGDEAAVKKILDSIPALALEQKPLLLGVRDLESKLRAARDRFLRAGGSPQEWEEQKSDVRRELLQRAALAGSTLAQTTAWYQSSA